MPVYRIKDWDKHFENNRTRELKRLDWVPIPNKMDGDGYTDLVDHPNAAAHLGAWLAIVEIASRQDPRGTLPEGRHGLAKTLARISRLPMELFEEAIPRLIGEVGWLEEIPEPAPSQDVAETSQGDAPRVRALREGKGTEGKGTEGKTAPAPKCVCVPASVPSVSEESARETKSREAFKSLWDAYPDDGRTDWGASISAWDVCLQRHSMFSLEQLFSEVMTGLIRWKASDKWQRGAIHSIANWLIKGIWKEHPPKARGQPASASRTDELNRKGIERAIREANERNGKQLHTG